MKTSGPGWGPGVGVLGGITLLPCVMLHDWGTGAQKDQPLVMQTPGEGSSGLTKYSHRHHKSFSLQ